MNGLIRSLGSSVEDIRCHLKHSSSYTIQYLEEAIKHESEHQNRSTVIKLLTASLNRKRRTEK